MAKTDSLESAKSRFDLDNRDYIYTTTEGEKIKLTVEDLNSITKFNKFRCSSGFLLWLKYKLRGSI